jgi:hypothetical protein
MSASITKDLLRALLIKYAGVPSQEAVLATDEMDEVRKYATEAALIADTANIVAGNIAYAIDTGAVFVKNASALVNLVAPGTDAEAFLQQKTTLTAAEIKALTTAQKTLVPAVAGKIIVLHDAVMELVAGSEVLTESADNMIINYVDDSGVAATGAIEATGFIDQLTNQHNVIKGVGIPVGSVAQLVNTPLVLDNTGDGDYAGNASNDAEMNVWCRYSLIEVS